VGDGIYLWLAKLWGSILQFDLGSQTLTLIDMPNNVVGINVSCSRIIRGEDGF
jgi:hypothetical protein